MDIAYDHIQEEALSPDGERDANKDGGEQPTLNAELAQAYKAISSSSWGAKIGAFVGTVKKQGESYYDGARQEYSAASSQASRGFSELVNRTRSLSLTKPAAEGPSGDAKSEESKQTDSGSAEASTSADDDASRDGATHDSGGVLSRFRTEAMKRLKELEKAEDAADEALLKFGTNIRNFLREAVKVAPPSDAEESGHGEQKTEILYESKDQEGKRVIHTTRFDAQLHVIHTRLESFLEDPASDEFSKWKEDFEVEKKTDQISADLEKYKELRAAMEKLVPDRVKYEDFWRRYYFLRHVIETEELRRKEMLKGVSAEAEEEVAWDEDSDTETPASTIESSKDTGKPKGSTDSPPSAMNNDSSTTLHAPQPETTPTSTTSRPADKSTQQPATTAVPHPPSKPAESRPSNDQQSQADSDASYDVVSGAPSGAPSHAPGSPKEHQEAAKRTTGTTGQQEESDEEDWE